MWLCVFLVPDPSRLWAEGLVFQQGKPVGLAEIREACGKRIDQMADDGVRRESSRSEQV